MAVKQIYQFPVEIEIAGAASEEAALEILSALLAQAWLRSDPKLQITSSIYPATSREELPKHDM